MCVWICFVSQTSHFTAWQDTPGLDLCDFPMWKVLIKGSLVYAECSWHHSRDIRNTTTLHRDCLRKGGKEAGTACAVVLNTDIFLLPCWTSVFTEKVDISPDSRYSPKKSKFVLWLFQRQFFSPVLCSLCYLRMCLLVTLSMVEKRGGLAAMNSNVSCKERRSVRETPNWKGSQGRKEQFC